MNRAFVTFGFGLVELMFALAVGGVILLAAVAFLGSSADGYARIEGHLSGEREYRILMGEMTSELGSAVFHRGIRFEQAGQLWPSDELAFLTLKPADAQSADQQIGDLCAVHYYVRDVVIGGRAVRCVMRGVRDSKQTFDALRENAVDSLFTPDEVADEPIALRVVSFDVDPLVMDGSGRWVDAPLPLWEAPDAVRIRLVVVRPSVAGRLATAADWDGVSAMASRELGHPDEARRNARLQVFESVLPFHHYEAH